MRNIMDILDGRMNRKNYITLKILLVIATMLLAVLLNQMNDQNVALLAVALVFYPLSFIVDTKRFHDVEKNTLWAAGLVLIGLSSFLVSGIAEDILTVIEAIGFLYLCIAKGDMSANEYGLAK